MQYYLSMKKKENLPLVTIWMDSEDITLSDISQRKTNTIWTHLYVELKTNKKTKLADMNRLVVARGKWMKWMKGVKSKKFHLQL